MEIKVDQINVNEALMASQLCIHFSLNKTSILEEAECLKAVSQSHEAGRSLAGKFMSNQNTEIYSELAKLLKSRINTK